jgi:polysaccharide export outer membrane protein
MTPSRVAVVVATLLPAAAAAAPQSGARPAPRQVSQQVSQQAQPPSATSAPTQPAADFLSPYDRDTLTPEYRIAPGDVLQVFVWREAELTREVRVRPDGYVTVPLLGDLFAVSKTLKGLGAELTQALSKFVQAPVVTVTLGESSTLRLYVVGEVMKPGEFPLLGRTTVMQALALAGGFKEYAKTDEIKVLRQELSVTAGRPKSREVVMPFNFKAIAQGQNLQQNYALKPGDVIVVP